MSVLEVDVIWVGHEHGPLAAHVSTVKLVADYFLIQLILQYSQLVRAINLRTGWLINVR